MPEQIRGQDADWTDLPLHILVVEDSPDGRDTLRTLLELHGYRVSVAADGVEGVDKGLTLRPPIALVDIGLPRLDGYEVARRLRTAFGPHILLVACTAYGRPEDRQQALEAGFDAHLTKPIDLESLMEWLDYLRGQSHFPPGE